jgi:hypothetical protein
MKHIFTSTVLLINRTFNNGALKIHMNPLYYPKVTVWCSPTVIIGSYFFEDGQAVTFLSYSYTHTIETFLMPVVVKLSGHEYVWCQ